MEHPDLHKGYLLVTRVIREKDVWKNKEDLHGGPNYYPDWEVIVESQRRITASELPAVTKKVAMNEAVR